VSRVRWLVVVSAALVAGAVLMAPARAGAAAADELPDGEGRKILLASCTSCHDLNEVTKLRGYYTRAQWRDVVVTMKEYGAAVDEKQVEILTDYLAQNLGKK
jgi:cytochrome c5